MSTSDFEPIHYSNERVKNYMAYIFFGGFALLTIGSLFLGIYLASFNNDWWVMLFFGPIAIVVGYFAYVFYPSERETVYSYKMTTEGIYQQWENKKKNEEIEEFISFDKTKQVLVGLYAERISTENRPFYRFYALLIIMHEDGYFFKRFLSAQDLQEWIKRLEVNISDIYYTDMDLQEAFYANAYTEVDFSQVEGSEEDIVSEHIGKEKYKNTLTVWKPDGIEEQVKHIQKEQILPETRRAEKRTFWIIFIYNLLFAILLLPTVPIDMDGFSELTNMILFGYFGVNLLLPCILVFYRKFTKWYLPLLYTFSSFIGNGIGLVIIFIIIGFPFIYETVILLNFFILLLWICALIIIKVFIFVAKLLIKYDL